MYRGKFDAKKKGAPDAEPVMPLNQPNDFDLELEIPSEPVSQASVGMPDSEPADAASPKARKSARKKKRKVRTGGVIFYTLYVLFLIAFVLALLFASSRLDRWLTDYQTAQPDVLAQQIYTETWENPDWGHIYDLAGIADTTYEGKDAFIAYMENKAGGQPLACLATTTGLSEDRTYAICAGETVLASFTMTRHDDPDTGIPHWEAGPVHIDLPRTERVTIQKMAGYTVYINGVALDDSFTVRTTYAVAEDYLPDGLPGLRVETQELTGLLMQPPITVMDDKGQTVDVVRDPESGIYSALVPAGSPTITEDQQSAALAAGQAYALYRVEKATEQELQKYFDASTEIYGSITKMEPWAQEITGYTISGERVTGYYSYSDTLFSAKVRLDLKATLEDDESSLHRLDATLFFALRDNAWKCVGMADGDVSRQVSEVRITFISEDVVLTSRFYETDLEELPIPIVSEPEGRVFSGWYRQIQAPDGTVSWEQVYAPSDSGSVALSAGSALEPMTLYALYEPAAAAPDNSTEETN